MEKNGTRMTQMLRITTDLIRANLPDPRHPRAINISLGYAAAYQ
jgi:hypothetical protein